MMIAAIETCWSSTPIGPMPAKAKATAKGTMEAMMSALRQPRASIIMARTTAKVWPMLTSAASTEAATFSGWKVAKAASTPSGWEATKPSTTARISLPTAVMSRPSSICTATSTAGAPSWNTGLSAGSTVSRRTSTTSPSRIRPRSGISTSSASISSTERKSPVVSRATRAGPVVTDPAGRRTFWPSSAAINGPSTSPTAASRWRSTWSTTRSPCAP